IKIHPLVCTAFNADFDGDQIAVHVPLSFEARAESRLLMLSSNNILSPASGKPLAVPTQDIVLGVYYLTYSPYKTEEEILKHAKKVYSSINEALLVHQFEVLNKEEGLSRVQEPIKVKINGKIRGTTIGRILFNSVFPEDFEFYNEIVKKSTFEKLVIEIYTKYGNAKTVEVLDKLKNLGFEYSTLSGISTGIGDLEIPTDKGSIIKEAEKKVEEINIRFEAGMLTQEEKEIEVSEIWGEASKRVGNTILENLGEENSLFIMADSGARGSKDQISQLAGMRGLMADATGKIIDFPIKSSFKEGLSVLEYFYSTHGARKGLADTALRTAKSGYLTRRLVDVSQDLIVREEDCGTSEGIVVTDLMNDGVVIESLKDRITGRVSCNAILDPETGESIVDENEEITPEKAEKIEKAGIKEVKIRSVLT
ncbi:MAG TPA: DNA-directed RNA polymerase subunit beta', partial [Candidatus Atribacteria bacterium]|nr:DNA-directed RNA polymerase subunit beta' [Candidatus Atribacteria bacterium]